MTQPRRAGGLCAAFVEGLPIEGSCVSVFDGTGRQSTVCASDALAARIDELQFELGEGPHWEALRTSHSVLVPALGESSPARWPIFSAAARELGVRAVFAFPMFVGAITVGVVGLHALRKGNLNSNEVEVATQLTQRITPRAVHLALRSAQSDGLGDVPAAPAMRREVHQATGMILAQLGVSATEAFVRLRAYAFSNSRTVHEVARAVVARELDFRDLD